MDSETKQVERTESSLDSLSGGNRAVEVEAPVSLGKTQVRCYWRTISGGPWRLAASACKSYRSSKIARDYAADWLTR